MALLFKDATFFDKGRYSMEWISFLGLVGAIVQLKIVRRQI